MNKLTCNNFQFAIQSLSKNNTSMSYFKKFQLFSNEELNSFSGILQLQSSVVPVVLVGILLCSESISLISSHYLRKPQLSFPFCTTSLHNVKDSSPLAFCTRASVNDVQIASIKH
jgi:hypothetical protein